MTRTAGSRPRPFGRRSVILAGAAVLALAGTAIARRLTAEPPSDEALVAKLFDDAARAAEEKRVSDAVACVSERFQGEGMDRRGVKQLVAFNVLRGDWVSVSIAGRQVAIQGDAALATVDVVLARGGKGKALADLLPAEATAHRIACRLERERDGWRIVRADWRAISLADALAGPPLAAEPR